MSLTKEQRVSLALVVGRIRAAVESDIASQATGRFGLHPTARRGVHVEPDEALDLGPTDFAVRRELVEVVAYLVQDGATESEAVARLIREATFTFVNRVVSIRVAEAVGALPASLADGPRSAGFRDFSETFPVVAANVEDGYWAYLQMCGDELAASVPALFDRRHPIAVFRPTHKTLEDVVALLATPALTGIWSEPETLGWTYQFFNSEDERRQMRAESAAPRNSRELAVRNQFFTPSYVVDWLLQNTLGRRLAEAGLELALPLLEGQLSPGKPLELVDVSVLDPAVGSGHFLLGAYSMLEELYAAQGVAPADAAPQILSALHGVDIDHRAAQVAQVVLVLRARRAGALAVAPPRIVTARGLPTSTEVRADIEAELRASVSALLDDLQRVLAEAPKLGTLLRVEHHVQDAVGARLSSPQLGDEPVVEGLERAVLGAAARVAREASATPAERLFAADSTDAMGFVELMQKRYDVVLMNPPFGAPIPETKTYLKAAYRESAVDLFSAFVARGREMLREDGYVGAITNRTGFFLKTFAGWRKEVLLPGIVCAADLGLGVLQDALVEAATYVVAAKTRTDDIPVRGLLRTADKSLLAQRAAGERFLPRRAGLRELPNAVLCYWVAPSVLQVYERFPRLAASGDVRVGLQTSDDFRFVRLWWEVRPESIGRNERWSPFAKGGEYAPWYADVHLVVDWEKNGRRIKDWGRGRPQNTDAYFKPGLTWTTRTASGFVVRALPAGTVFAHKGCLVRGPDNAALSVLLNNRVARYLIELQLAAGETTSSGGAARSYEVGLVSDLPTPHLGTLGLTDVGREQAVAEAADAAHNETDRHFAGWQPSAPSITHRAERLETLARADSRIAAAYGLDEPALAAISTEVGPSPGHYPRDTRIDIAELTRLYQLPMQRLVDLMLATTGGARHVAVKSHLVDRRLELLSHYFQAHPATLAKHLVASGLRPPGEEEANAKALLSYLVGVAFGRWDVRVRPHQAVADPWAEVAPVPPAMLVDQDGVAARRAPAGYPVELPSGPLLHDDPGHHWDIASRVEAVASQMEDGGTLIERALQTLGQTTLRGYLRTRFMTDHLELYSKSRRRAPIYWQLGNPAAAWRLWLYYPDLTRESIFAMVTAAEDKLRGLNTRIARLEQEPSSRQRQEQLEGLENTRDAVRAFASSVAALAHSGWVPDLDDGAVLNAAPFADVLSHPAWAGDAAEQHQRLTAGEYPWATVQRELYVEER
ncbi:MAG TPA: hypothetical protein VNU26_08505 [Mycobacteriales bacterium]|nr:hypothetical protein [Mycobacteriales bacterium]